MLFPAMALDQYTVSTLSNIQRVGDTLIGNVNQVVDTAPEFSKLDDQAKAEKKANLEEYYRENSENIEKAVEVIQRDFAPSPASTPRI